MRIGLGMAGHITEALINVGVDSDLCWPAEDGSVNVHDGLYRTDIRVGHLGGHRYGAIDVQRDGELLREGGLTTVVTAVHACVTADLSNAPDPS